MDNWAEELEKYRLKKRREEHLLSCKNRLIELFKNKIPNEVDQIKKNDEAIPDVSEDQKMKEENAEEPIAKTDKVPDSNNESDYVPTCEHEDNIVISYVIRATASALWIILLFIAIELGFATVFLIVTALFAIYFNTRTTPKNPNEVSAYSVFNKNCESIDGTLKAEQFERELGIRS